MGNGKAWNSFADAYKGEGVNPAPQPEESLPDMVCPEIPFHGTDNFWSASCKIKQRMPEHWKTCYPHCKSGANSRLQFKKEQHERTPAQLIRTEYASQLVETICKLYKDGCKIPDIAKRICRSEKLVRKRLSEEGLTNQQRGPTKKEMMFEEWLKEPTLTNQYMIDKYSITKTTTESYRRDFRRQHPEIAKADPNSLRERIFTYLDDHPDINYKDLKRVFNCVGSTASSYLTQYRASKRGRNAMRRTDSREDEMETLADVLPKEIKRVQELITIYRDPSLQGMGEMAAVMMQHDIDEAIKAMAEQDIVAMVRLCQELRKYKE